MKAKIIQLVLAFLVFVLCLGVVRLTSGVTMFETGMPVEAQEQLEKLLKP